MVLLAFLVSIVRVSLDQACVVTCAIAATEALVGQAAAWLDAGEEVPVEAYIACKTSGPELLGHAVDQAMQLLGATRYCERIVCRCEAT